MGSPSCARWLTKGLIQDRGYKNKVFAVTDKGYAADVTIANPPSAFSWRRRWDGDPALDVYTAYYEMPVRVCVEGCP